MATTDIRGNCSAGAPDGGSALVVVLLLGVLLAAVGTSTALVADIEIMVASNHRDALGVRYAAEGAADFVVQELALLPDWTPVLNGGRRSVLAGPVVLPLSAGGTAVDAAVLTSSLQQDSYGSGVWAANTPRWRLFAHGVLGADLPFAGLPGDTFALVWVADDITESDGDPSTDDNGVVVVRARAMGPRRSQADVQVVVARVAPGIVRRVSMRLVP
jgi:hypothetical protein